MGIKELGKSLIYLASRPFGTVIHVETDEPIAAITFDDGPNPEVTPRVLEVLAAHDAKATFFMIGSLAARHRDVVEQVGSAGHALGNHSWDHASQPLLKSRWRRAQLAWCQEALEPYGEPLLFRAPYCHQTIASHWDAVRMGYEVVEFNATPSDWEGESARTLCERMRAELRPGCIILLHDGLHAAEREAYLDRAATVEALEMFLGEFGEAYEFVTIPELMRRAKPRKWPRFSSPDLSRLHAQR